MTDSWTQVQELFEQAVACPPAERAALLADACGDDAELRAEVESLLESHEQAADSFLRPPEPPAGVRRPSPPTGPDPLLGQRVGRYRVKSVIASGGMGTVYLAEQEQPKRDVALKVMRAGIASRSALRRFEYESQILAHLRHPNIAQVYEAGTHSPSQEEGESVPYFAMEYIPNAKPITTYAADHNLTTKQRLELFGQVCDAVHHGHQKGIIHRDLKPANILVDSSGEPKVIDFGVARATDSDVAVTTLRTDVGELIGTLQYMSPEQCAADPHELDTRSDVYSLGVVLYELLCGQRPYDLARTPLPSAARIICEKLPPRPSTVNRKLRGDLELIVLKALEKDREQRYQSAIALAEDIHRYVNREPIAARPPTAWVRAVRWVGRHPVVATTLICLAIGLCILAASRISASYLNWYLDSRPYQMSLSEDGREARMLSVSNRILHTWPTETHGGIKFAQMVEQPAELGGWRLAVLGFGNAVDYPFGDSLRVFDAEGDLDNPLWIGRIETEDIPRRLREERGFVGEQFVIDLCKIADVFPERPGFEIVADHAHVSYSHRAIRVYGLDGKVLYQVWHDGRIGAIQWMPAARLLVFVGLNSEVHWEKRGHSELRGDDPCVVFAVRPTLDFIVDKYLLTETGDDPLSPVWYRCLLPPDAIYAIEYGLRPSEGGYADGRHVALQLTSNSVDNASVWWILDEFGRMVPGARVVTDMYGCNLDKLPDPNEFKLAPLPSIVATSQPAEDSSGEQDEGP